jgi:hypothetical protein
MTIDPFFRDLPLRSEAKLKALGFGEFELREHKRLVDRYLKLLTAYHTAEEAKDWDASYIAEQEIVALATTVHFRGEDPNDIPLETLRYIVNKAPNSPAPDAVTMQYRDKIKSKAPSIRAKCVKCMGGAPSLVKGCPSTTCLLWPFRMGTNPVRGALSPPVTEILIPEELAEELKQERVDNEDAEKDDVGA